MRRRIGVLVVSLASAFALAAPVASAEGTHPGEHSGAHLVDLKDVPEKARATINNNVGEGQITTIEEAVENGRTIYEVKYTTPSGTKRELHVADNGELLSNERD